MEPMKKTGICEICLAERMYTVKEETLTETIRGHELTFLEKTPYCAECNSPMFIPHIIDENITYRQAKIREADNIISVEDITTILEKYNIGKRPLSLLLGWGNLTIKRYLDGAVPSKKYSDVLMELLNNPNKMAYLLEKNKEQITSVAYRKCYERTMDLLKSDSNSDSNKKIQVVANYIICKNADTTPLSLQKLLYYSQAFVKLFTNNFLFDNDCEAWKHGPVYYCICEKYRAFRQRETIDKSFCQSNTIDKDSLLSDTEKEIIDGVIKNLGIYTGNILEAMTHEEKPWKLSRNELDENEYSNDVIPKEVIDDYFKEVQEIYNLVTINDIERYTEDLLRSINY